MCRDFTRPDLPAGDPNDQATIPDLSAYGTYWHTCTLYNATSHTCTYIV